MGRVFSALLLGGRKLLEAPNGASQHILRVNLSSSIIHIIMLVLENSLVVDNILEIIFKHHINEFTQGTWP